MKENQDLQVERIGNQLENYSVALCVTGGIAAIESPKIARHLRRYGADVKVYTTPLALDFVGEASLQWGSGNSVVTKLTGNAEHICLEDIVLVAPATLNTINKIFLGIADNPVTTLIASALGSKIPVYLAPTMHISLYNNPIFQENLQKAEKYGLKIIEPRFGENKAKIANTRAIVQEILNYFGEKNAKA
ncbi:MAG: flavoprotein [Candidatus Nanoarchaeia archaeon]|nr:flavoprotein [Candidatus Nanoarchaeia archaeon]MDD5740592.1 flavoprotein [Candidatus Nanoarchaeia archaeon]